MTAVLLRPADWTRNAACDGLDPAPWDGDRPDLLPLARQVCARCPVADACLDDAITMGEAYMVRGGLTPAERNDVARLRGAPKASPAGRWQHGTPSGYKAHGCRCDRCEAAHARDVTAWRARRRLAPATTRETFVVLTHRVGRGTRAAFPGQLALDLGVLL